eukprot:scaffold14886_cov108-Cylindrotheca_fusiformis.AAC.3
MTESLKPIAIQRSKLLSFIFIKALNVMSEEENRRTSAVDLKRKRKRSGRDTGTLRDDDPNYFVYTSNMKSENIPRSTLTHLRVDSSVTFIPCGIFHDCTKLVNVQLPQTLKFIGDFAFVRCESLQSVQFVSKNGSLLTSSNADMDNSSIVFPENVSVSIFSNAFRLCYRIWKVTICSSSIELDHSAFSHCSGLFSVELPNGLQEIKEWLFMSCYRLEEVKLPLSVRVIHNQAFTGCYSLASINLPFGLQWIGRMCFQDCLNLRCLEIPDTVSTIGSMAFMNCISLENIRLPATLDTIAHSLFEECIALEYIKIPETVREIQRWSFSACYSMSHLRIPSSVTKIERYAFNRCTNMFSLELPEGLETAQPFSDDGDDHDDDSEYEFEPIYDEDADGPPIRGAFFDREDGFDYCGIFCCSSLVNVVMPLHQPCGGFQGNLNEEHKFVKSLKLGKDVEGYDGLVRKLKHRFDNCPLHRLCYYQSYQPLAKTMQELRNLLDDDPSAGITQLDAFGMTPLHVAALVQSPSLSIIVALTNGENHHMFHVRDFLGSTPMDYLCRNVSPDAFDVIRALVQNRLGCSRWLDCEEARLLRRLNEALATKDRWSRYVQLGRILFRIASCEQREVCFLVELFLWKIKLDDECSSEIAKDRQNCRILCGASIVISNVLSFLGKVEGKDYSYYPTHRRY